MSGLKRTLGVGQCIFFGVGSILGAGIYTIVGKVAGWSGNMLWVSFLLASATALFTAFSYAELSAAYPKSGGEYEYTKKAFGEKTGIATGMIISLNGIISGATVALGFAGYLSSLLSVPVLIGALAIIGLIFLVNISGIRESSTVNIIFTLIEAAGLVLVVVAAFSKPEHSDYFKLPEKGLSGLFAGAALAFYAFIGFEEIVKLAEETKDPQKNIPRALFAASVIVLVIYTLVTIAAVTALAPDRIAASSSPLADIVSSRYGQAGAVIISIIALFSTSNTILSNMLGSSRVLLNIGKQTTRLKKLSKVSAKNKVPVPALVLILVLMCCFALIGKIETVAMIANLFIFTTFLLVNIAVIVCRYKDPNRKRPYKIPFNIGRVPVFAVIGIAMVLFLLFWNIYGLVNPQG